MPQQGLVAVTVCVLDHLRGSHLAHNWYSIIISQMISRLQRERNSNLPYLLLSWTLHPHLGPEPAAAWTRPTLFVSFPSVTSPATCCRGGVPDGRADYQ